MSRRFNAAAADAKLRSDPKNESAALPARDIFVVNKAGKVVNVKSKHGWSVIRCHRCWKVLYQEFRPKWPGMSCMKATCQRCAYSGVRKYVSTAYLREHGLDVPASRKRNKLFAELHMLTFSTC